MALSDSRQSERPVPSAFEAFGDIAAYVNGTVSRSAAITEARDVCWLLMVDYTRQQLRVSRVFLRPIEGKEADEFFHGEYDSGWIECPKGTPGAVPMWRVEPR